AQTCNDTGHVNPFDWTEMLITLDNQNNPQPYTPVHRCWVTLGCGDSVRIDSSILLLTLSDIVSGVGIELGLGLANTPCQ
ncbi:MAG: hypothetical protein ACKPKO_47190, partial [Candidatus Fonsibacter sp.]